jgi:hypothetical protein
MKNCILLILVVSAIALPCRGQDTWTTVRIEGFGSVELPPNMEIQGGAYRELDKQYREIHGAPAAQVVFQQKNLNNFDPNSFKTYARVCIRTIIGEVGDFHALYDFDIPDSEISEINDFFKTDIYENLPKLDAIVLEWNDAIKILVNGFVCLKFNYRRKMKTNPPVDVTQYFIQNYDRFHIVTFEYRIVDSEIWKSNFDRVKNSLTIIQQP